MIVGFESLF